MRKTIVMGVESTAHTFGIGIVDEEFNILADVRDTMLPGPTLGIDPKLAAEHHAKVATKVLKSALKEANIELREISAIAYSKGPGLGPALRVGATLARALAYKYKVPLYPVHHGLGHVELACAVLKVKDPLVVLVSGGHTAIIGFNKGRWRIYGETLDITIGNLFDVFAREIGLPFPGGPKVEELAKKGKKYIEMPYTIKGNNMVYSGLLTYAINLIKSERVEDVAYSLQETAFSILVEATERALMQLKKEHLVMTGGVASNDRLFEMMCT
ncbi:MAG: tRNA (adenosine(37)-N6)-threonylcarbamoyltransferase complex transferase subunit TsaD, partial [Candidatus Geothermarchaeota archaeon]